MSDTGNFSSPNVDVPDDAATSYKRLSKRLDHLESTLSEFRASSEVLKDLGHSFIVLGHEFSSFKQACHDHFEMTNKRWLEHHHKLGDSDAKIGTADRKTVDLQDTLQEHAKQMAQAITLLDRKIQESKDGLVKGAEFSALQRDLKANAVETQGAHGTLRAQIVTLTKDKEFLAARIAELENFVGERNHDLSSMNRWIAAATASMSKDIVDCKNDVESKLVAHRQKSEKDIDALRQELQGSPSSIESVKAQISQKLTSVEMDAANSLLRSKNSDSQITILQKKIENIQLVLKNIELR